MNLKIPFVAAFFSSAIATFLTNNLIVGLIVGVAAGLGFGYLTNRRVKT